MSECRRLQPLLETYCDGELPADSLCQVEQHLEECADCAARARFSQSLRLSTRRATAVAPSDAFRARLAAALEAERDREQQTSAPRARPRALDWRQIVPMAAAAAATLVWASGQSRVERAVPSDPQAAGSTSFASVDGMIDQFVDEHLRAEEPSITEPALVQRFEPEVGVPVHVPSLAQYGARWEGGRIVPMQSRRAASLRYRLGDHKVTMYVYDSRRFPLRVSLEPRVVRNVPVYVGARRGYTLAAVEQKGVGFAVTSDLGDQENAELVAAAY